jgi:hypothetical protein
MNDAGDSGSNCHIGMEFKSGFIGQISQVKFYLSNINTATFTNNLKFQGSMDKNSWSDLFTVDENVHEGWNYHKWNDAASYPKFRAYRFYGSAAGSCKLNEIKFAGVKSRDNNDQNLQCDVKLYLDGASQDLTAVTYEGGRTASLTSMNPRFGPVTGGTQVTFTGVNFV